MTTHLDKSKLLEALNADVTQAKEKMGAYNLNNAREAIIHHICKDELEYVESLIEAIEYGYYDVVN